MKPSASKNSNTGSIDSNISDSCVENNMRKEEIAFSEYFFTHNVFTGFVMQTHSKMGLFLNPFPNDKF